MSRGLHWTKGAPEKVQPGMLIRWSNGDCTLVGCDIPIHADELARDDASGWAWVVRPYELQWMADMAPAFLEAQSASDC